MRMSVVFTWPGRPRILGPALGALLLLGSALAGAQDVTGTVSGTVVDDTKQVLPGATVTLVNEQTRSSRTAPTDSRGEFRFVSVYPGHYTVRWS
jgi:protocatechuate 3,4-dioxygenase beta subunit